MKQAQSAEATSEILHTLQAKQEQDELDNLSSQALQDNESSGGSTPSRSNVSKTPVSTSSKRLTKAQQELRRDSQKIADELRDTWAKALAQTAEASVKTVSDKSRVSEVAVSECVDNQALTKQESKTVKNCYISKWTHANCRNKITKFVTILNCHISVSNEETNHNHICSSHFKV